MTDRNSRKIMVPPQGNMLRNFVNRLKLIARLMGDSRVSAFLKLLPLASLAYLISPVDLAPNVVLPVIGVLDDAAILWIGSTLFVELCPPGVVEEYVNQLTGGDEGGSNDIVDADSTDSDSDTK